MHWLYFHVYCVPFPLHPHQYFLRCDHHIFIHKLPSWSRYPNTIPWTRVWKVEPSRRDLILFIFILNAYVCIYLCDACVDVCILLPMWRQGTTLWSCFSPLCGSWRWNSHSWVCSAGAFTQWAIWLPRRRCLDIYRSILTHGLVPPVVDTKPGSLSSPLCPCSIPTHLSLRAKKLEVPH